MTRSSKWVWKKSDFFVPVIGAVLSVKRNWDLDDPDETIVASIALLVATMLWLALVDGAIRLL